MVESDLQDRKDRLVKALESAISQLEFNQSQEVQEAALPISFLWDEYKACLI
jgi:hypothetical protein